MFKHLKIYWKLIRFSASLETEYRFSFFMEILVEIAYFFVTLLGMKVLFWNVQEIAGWKFAELLTLYGINMVFSELVLGTTFIFNLRSLPEKISYGGFDLILTKPINSQFAVSLWRPYFAMIPGILAGLGIALIGFNSSGLEFVWLNFIKFIWLFVCGLVMAYSLGMMISTLAMWWTNAVSLPMLAQQFLFLAKNPKSVFDKPWRILFMTLIPTIFMVSLPTEALLGQRSAGALIFAPIIAFTMLKASNLFWQKALKNYCSASS